MLMKSKKPLFNRVIIYFFLLVSVISFLLCVWSIAPAISRIFSNKKTQGEVLEFRSTNDETEFKLVYNYYNEYEKRHVELIRRIHKRTYNKLNVGDTIEVVYSKLFPFQVHIP